MSALGDTNLGDRDLIYFGEVIRDGLLDLVDDGVLKTASATSLALSRDGQDHLYENIERYAEEIVLHPDDISNNPALINRFSIVAVNSALKVNLFGHVNSTHVNGNYGVNGVGGSADFNRNAAIAVLALPSTDAEDSIPRIVSAVPYVATLNTISMSLLRNKGLPIFVETSHERLLRCSLRIAHILTSRTGSMTISTAATNVAGISHTISKRHLAGISAASNCHRVFLKNRTKSNSEDCLRGGPFLRLDLAAVFPSLLPTKNPVSGRFELYNGIARTARSCRYSTSYISCRSRNLD